MTHRAEVRDATHELPNCRTDAEEAKWFEENQERLPQMFERTAASGTLGKGDDTVGITVRALAESRRTDGTD